MSSVLTPSYFCSHNFYAWNTPPTLTLGSCYNKNSLGYQTAKCVGRRQEKQKQKRPNTNFWNIPQQVSTQIWGKKKKKIYIYIHTHTHTHTHTYIYNGLYLCEKELFSLYDHTNCSSTQGAHSWSLRNYIILPKSQKSSLDKITCVYVGSAVSDSEMSWTVACQAPLFMELCRQGY